MPIDMWKIYYNSVIVIILNLDHEPDNCTFKYNTLPILLMK